MTANNTITRLTRRQLLTTVAAGAAVTTSSCRKTTGDAAARPTGDVVSWTVRVIADAIRRREVSSYEVVTACVRQIERVNPRLNAVVCLRAEEALADAKRADDLLRRGGLVGPLFGVPMTIKDSFDTAGVVSTAGTKGRASFVPAVDATVVARLKAAGAILLGKTNTPEFTLGIVTDNLVYGRTGNPYDPSRSPGGSSGGAAAIVAAQGSPFDIGSDTGGSIRMPAHFCGITGLKPTVGRVPRTGHIISFGGMLDSWTQIGPLARRIDDLELIWPILAGNDWQDPSIVDAPIPLARDVHIRGLKVAMFSDNGIDRVTHPVSQAVVKAAKVLEEAGVVIEEKRPTGIERSEQLVIDFGNDGGAWLRRLVERAGTVDVSAAVKSTLASKPDSVADLTHSFEAADQWKSDLLSFMREYDALLCPVEAYTAIPDRDMLQRAKATTYVQPFNLTGQPAVAVRADTSPDGMPVGVQIVSRRWREDVALALAGHLESALGGWKAPAL
jgi:amidase